MYIYIYTYVICIYIYIWNNKDLSNKWAVFETRKLIEEWNSQFMAMVVIMVNLKCLKGWIDIGRYPRVNIEKYKRKTNGEMIYR